MVKKDAEGGARAVRIVLQFRDKETRACDLDCAGHRLAIRVATENVEASADRYRIDARMSNTADAFVASAAAGTKLEALREVAKTWTERAPILGLAPIDWSGVERALTAVRAV